MRTEWTPEQIRPMIAQIEINPDNAPSPRGWAGDHLISKFMETSYPTRESQNN